MIATSVRLGLLNFDDCCSVIVNEDGTGQAVDVIVAMRPCFPKTTRTVLWNDSLGMLMSSVTIEVTPGGLIHSNVYWSPEPRHYPSGMAVELAQVFIVGVGAARQSRLAGEEAVTSSFAQASH